MEWNGIDQRSNSCACVREAVAPRITVIIEAYGGAISMHSKHIGADLKTDDPEAITRGDFATRDRLADDLAAKLAEKEAEYAELFAHPTVPLLVMWTRSSGRPTPGPASSRDSPCWKTRTSVARVGSTATSHSDPDTPLGTPGPASGLT